uniref:Uncharacterized protein n=1 Tax=Parascaris univalens TaxID=6257 RepID=A0A915A4E6_PARUN
VYKSGRSHEQLGKMPESSENAVLNDAENNGVSVTYRHATSRNPLPVQMPQEFVKLKEMENIMNGLTLKIKEAKSAILSEEYQNKCMQERANKLAAEMQEKTAFIRESENWRLTVALEAERLSEIWNTENGKILLADTRLSENAHHVRALERQIEYTRRFIERKRNAVSAWQNSTTPLLHKEELLALESENNESARKIVIWQKENSRLALILDAMKERESEMQFAVDRCYQRKKRAQDECHRMRCRIVYLSSVLDSRFTYDAQGESSDTEQPSERNSSLSSTECAYQPQYMTREQGRDGENTVIASSRQTGQETQLPFHIRR